MHLQLTCKRPITLEYITTWNNYSNLQIDRTGTDVSWPNNDIRNLNVKIPTVRQCSRAELQSVWFMMVIKFNYAFVSFKDWRLIDIVTLERVFWQLCGEWLERNVTRVQHLMTPMTVLSELAQWRDGIGVGGCDSKGGATGEGENYGKHFSATRQPCTAQLFIFHDKFIR